MAAVAPSHRETAELLQKLSLDQTKTLEIPEPTKKTPVLAKDSNNGQIPASITPGPEYFDPAYCYPGNYPAFYYGNEFLNDWDEYMRSANTEGVEMPPAMYGDMYHGYGYGPYGPYSPAGSPAPTMGPDGLLYQYPAPYFQPLNPSSVPYTPTPTAPTKGDNSIAADKASLTVEAANGNTKDSSKVGGVQGNNGSATTKQTYLNSQFGANWSALPSSGFQDPRMGFNGSRSPVPWSEYPLYTDVGQPRPTNNSSTVSSMSRTINNSPSKNHNYQPQSNYMGLHPPRQMSNMGTANGYINKLYPNNKLYGQYGTTYRSGLGYGSNGYDSRVNGRGWLSVDGKYNKPRGRSNGFYGNENIDGLNELNRGPRAKHTKNQKGYIPVPLAVKSQNTPSTETKDDEKDKLIAVAPDREQYNKVDFPEVYSDAKFFVIKSYSEDDVHKSIKYNVWASTPNGNKKLDAAYQEAQQKDTPCPVFLLFSVNTSGQFVGVAEMTGPVDFHKNFEYWQQDKWNGCFPVKWHIVKDVSNSLLKHITLENNENKPVTNSRDTQEVKLDQGIQILKIFKENSSKTCILDDFYFYEGRQKTIQEKKAKQLFQKQVWEGKSIDGKKGVNGESETQKSSDAPLTDSAKDSSLVVEANGDVKQTETQSVAKSGEGAK